jgi:hypothetical protein
MKTNTLPRTRKRAKSSSSSRLVLTIGETFYSVIRLPHAPDEGRRAYRLVKADGAAYDLAETRYGPECDCPDYIFRRDGLDPGGCKHVKALIRHGMIATR